MPDATLGGGRPAVGLRRPRRSGASSRRRERAGQEDADAARESLKLAREAVRQPGGRRADYFGAALEDLLERGYRGKRP